MENTHKTARITALSVLALMIAASVMAIPAMASDAEADEPVTTDLGSMWSLGLYCIYAPPADSAPAETVTYDFGDGTPTVTVGPSEHPEHDYAEKGTYTITQTATNTAGSTVTYWKVTMLGYPFVTFNIGHGQDDIVVDQTAYNVPVTVPSAPSVEGMRFVGWYTSTDNSEKIDPSVGITEPVTYYAKYVSDTAYVAQILDPSTDRIIATYELGSDGQLSVSDVADLTAKMLKDGKIYAGLYHDKDLKSKVDVHESPVDSDRTYYAKYTPVVPDIEDTGSMVVIGATVAGIVALIATAVFRRPVILLAAVVLFALAGLVHTGVISW